MTDSRAISIHDRLLNHAKERGEDFTVTLRRYAIERFLYRLSISPYRERFLLKGALLFDLWFNSPLRPTRDADFLGLGSLDPESLAQTVREICSIPGEDGILFDQGSVRVSEIREEANYGGLRAKLLARLGSARATLQLDVGFGDAVTPGPERARCPTILADMPAPELLAYPRATVIAEKLEAIVKLGIANSRMKDYFDLLALSREPTPGQLSAAIVATLSRRGTALPGELPIGLSRELAEDRQKQTQWSAFLSRNRLEGPGLPEAVDRIAAVFGPFLLQARRSR